MKRYGDPVLTLRVPRETIAGLKISARRRGETTSQVIRDLVNEHLREEGISVPREELPGQMHIDE